MNDAVKALEQNLRKIHPYCVPCSLQATSFLLNVPPITSGAQVYPYTGGIASKKNTGLVMES